MLRTGRVDAAPEKIEKSLHVTTVLTSPEDQEMATALAINGQKMLRVCEETSKQSFARNLPPLGCIRCEETPLAF